MAADNSFFEESREQSQVKTAIVSKYFWAWAKVILPTVRTRPPGRIAYIDLFAGPGRYRDGTRSTPLLVLEQAIEDTEMSQRLVTIFNDAEPANTKSLLSEIESLPGIDKLKYRPVIRTEEVGEKIVKMFESMRMVPTLFFVDPWGYKGLSLRLVNSVIKDWGCDCIFFFNYNRINMGISNDIVRDHMDALFGPMRANALRERLTSLDSIEREFVIVEEIAHALQEMGGRYVLPFRFKAESGARTSHHLIFVSKSVKGYEIMKEIMAKGSSSTDQGVPSFEYNQASQRQPLLFQLSSPLDDLADLLLRDFSGRRLSMIDIFDQHNVGTPYIKRNYKDALLKLEAAQKITTLPPADMRKQSKGTPTFADNVQVTFPSVKNR